MAICRLMGMCYFLEGGDKREKFLLKLGISSSFLDSFNVLCHTELVVLPVQVFWPIVDAKIPTFISSTIYVAHLVCISSRSVCSRFVLDWWIEFLFVIDVDLLL